MRFEHLKDKTVAVAGCGGLGTNVAVHLAGMGVGRLLLYDFDTVTESNLDRQFMFTAEDCGKPKAPILAEKLLAYNPLMAVEVTDTKISEQTEFDADIIMSCADNAECRRFLNSYAERNGIPLINGGIDSSVGTVYVYIPGKSAGLERAGLLNDTENPVSVSSTAGITGALMAEECARVLSGDYSDAGKLIIYEKSEINKMKIKV